MKQTIIDIADKAFTERLSKEEFQAEFASKPENFCALRMTELEAFAELLVEQCCSLVSAKEAIKIKKHFEVE